MRITAEELRRRFDYSPVVGVFERKSNGRSPKATWALAGSVKEHGYVTVKVGRKNYMAHQLAWLYMTGEWPDKDIDHIDGDRSNNAFANLRLASRSQNAWNSTMPKTNKSGVKGVTWDKGRSKWVARLKRGGKIVFNKYFKDINQAKTEIEAFRAMAHGEFSNNGVHGYRDEGID